MADLAEYGVEDTCDNRIMLADFLPEDIDEQEVLADSFLLEKWQEHIDMNGGVEQSDQCSVQASDAHNGSILMSADTKRLCLDEDDEDDEA